MIPMLFNFSYLTTLLLLLQLFLFCDVETIAPGVTYEFQKATDPAQAIHILRVNPKKAKIALTHALNDGLGKEPLSSIAERTGAIAAINGGFFRYWGTFDGQATGLLKIDGEYYSMGKKPRGAMGWKKDYSAVLFNRLQLTPKIKMNGIDYPVDGLNHSRNHKDAILYTACFHRTTLTSPGGTEFLIQNDTIIACRKQKGDSFIPAGGYVYSLGKDAKVDMTSIASANKAEVSFQLETFLPTKSNELALWHACDYIIGGAPLIIKDGVSVSDFSQEEVRHSFLIKPHPRTAIGTCPDGTWVFVVVDGRNPLLSVGFTINELTALMQSLGCTNALNLDGGGSTTMTVATEVVNYPCSMDEEDERNEKSQRPISDAIIILPLDS